MGWGVGVLCRSFAISGWRPGRHALMTERVCAICIHSVVFQLLCVEGEDTERLKKYSCALTAAITLNPSVWLKKR